MSFSEVHYPNLAPCRVVLNGAGGGDGVQPPVRLPASILAAARQPDLPPLYDFALGMYTDTGVLSFFFRIVIFW
jgi:hypothetical protein